MALWALCETGITKVKIIGDTHTLDVELERELSARRHSPSARRWDTTYLMTASRILGADPGCLPGHSPAINMGQAVC